MYSFFKIKIKTYHAYDVVYIVHYYSLARSYYKTNAAT